MSTSEQVANPFRFDGAYYDSATTFYKMGARYYTAGLGRWTQTDAVPGGLSSPQSLNLYTFVGNNPINFVDPTGLDVVHDCAKNALIGSIVGAGTGAVGGALAGGVGALPGAATGALLGTIGGCATAVLGDLLP